MIECIKLLVYILSMIVTISALTLIADSLIDDSGRIVSLILLLGHLAFAAYDYKMMFHVDFYMAVMTVLGLIVAFICEAVLDALCAKNAPLEKTKEEVLRRVENE